MRPHDHIEDFSHENGNYWNICATCTTHFIGLKARRLCKLCSDGWVKCDDDSISGFSYQTFDEQLYRKPL